jgi:hypothetical protein
MSSATPLGAARVDCAGAVDLWALVDWGELRRRGWRPDGNVFAPNAADPVFGFVVCATANCNASRGRGQAENKPAQAEPRRARLPPNSRRTG